MTEMVLHRPGDGIEVIVDEHGEVLVLKDAGTDQLASALGELRDHETAVREVKAAISRELHARMDHEASWTLSAENWTVSGQSPDRVTYDAKALWDVVHQLVQDDLIPPATAEAAVEREWAYKAKVAGINRLKKLGGAVAVEIEKCATPLDLESRRVTIKRRSA